MLPKQTEYKVGMYLRLSRDDERVGESLSIENQRTILTKYIEEQHGWTLYDEYVDDGISGTTFDRPGVQRMLEDAKAGKINLIICKDLSRFGRNYIQVGQYTDYIFPMYNIRFIALNDNIDTAKSDSASMDMMPIMNVFNEWHAANTSKKLRAVFEANAKSGKYKTNYPPYGYMKGTDKNCTPIVDPYSSEIVRRIFEMRAAGYNVKRIVDVLNREHILVPSDYYYHTIGKPNPYRTSHLWGVSAVKRILRNPIYLGHLIQLRTTTVSYKNHKTVRRDENDWAVTENNHEAIISQELWDRVREVDDSVSNGKSSKNGITMPLSGLCYCSDCGSKMKQNSNIHCKSKPCYTCGRYSRFGKEYCSSHTIRLELIESLVLQDIQHQIDFVMNEPDVRAKLLAYKQGENAVQDSSDRKRQHDIVKRIDELDGLIQSVYEDKVAGKVPEKVCIGLLEKYQAEKDKLTAEQDELRKRSEATRQDERDVDEYIRRMKSYAGAKKLTREMALELIEYIKVDAHPGHRNLPRTIHVFYKLIDKPLTNKRNALE
jgi:DNA invertase Pin-like site-specific DNA recombinase